MDKPQYVTDYLRLCESTGADPAAPGYTPANSHLRKWLAWCGAHEVHPADPEAYERYVRRKRVYIPRSQYIERNRLDPQTAAPAALARRIRKAWRDLDAAETRLTAIEDARTRLTTLLDAPPAHDTAVQEQAEQEHTTAQAVWERYQAEYPALTQELIDRHRLRAIVEQIRPALLAERAAMLERAAKPPDTTAYTKLNARLKRQQPPVDAAERTLVKVRAQLAEWSARLSAAEAEVDADPYHDGAAGRLTHAGRQVAYWQERERRARGRLTTVAQRLERTRAQLCRLDPEALETGRAPDTLTRDLLDARLERLADEQRELLDRLPDPPRIRTRERRPRHDTAGLA